VNKFKLNIPFASYEGKFEDAENYRIIRVFLRAVNEKYKIAPRSKLFSKYTLKYDNNT